MSGPPAAGTSLQHESKANVATRGHIPNAVTVLMQACDAGHNAPVMQPLERGFQLLPAISQCRIVIGRDGNAQRRACDYCVEDG